MTDTQPNQSATATQPSRSAPVARRIVLAAAGAVGAAGALAACGGGGGGSNTAASPTPVSPAPTKSGASGAVLAQTGDVPVGGGVILDEQEVVITQPRKDEFFAFTAVCPHMGCLVSQIKDDRIICSCHMSAFALDNGAVVSGPATTGLAQVGIVVAGTEIRGA